MASPRDLRKHKRGSPAQPKIRAGPASRESRLTNAARHGDGTPVSIRVDIGGDRTTVTVDSGRSSATVAAAGGAGLIVMSERVQALGGKLLAGPRPGGWRVEAVLPS